MHHVTLYREQDRFCGWPANNGCWSYDGGHEIVVGFVLGHMKHDVGTSLHRIDRERGSVYMQARSIDSGETWDAVETALPSGEASDFPGGIDFTAPGFALKCVNERFYVSTDRAQTWQGPYRLPKDGDFTIQARTDYLVFGPADMMVFLTATKSNGQEGRVFCIRTADGGKSWSPPVWIGPEPEGFSIMPSSLRLPDGRLLCAIRRRQGDAETGDLNWIELWRSSDDGATWEYVTKPAPNTGPRAGNPPSMVQLSDGRIVITYAYRDRPFGIRATVSADGGDTWRDGIILRDDGGDGDIGYTRTVVRPDGKLFTAYYYDERPEGERFIGGTIWEAE